MNTNKLQPETASRTQARRPATTTNSHKPQNAQKNYERYLALARAEALAGDEIAAENYYQHAEHYFRSMNH